MAVPARVDEAGGRVDEQPEPAERALALEPGDEVVGQRDPLQGRAEHELARVEDERLLGVDLDELGQPLHLLLDVDEGVARVAEDAEELVHADVHAGGLQQLLGVRVDADPALVEQAPDGAVREDHGHLQSISSVRGHDTDNRAQDRHPGPSQRRDPRPEGAGRRRAALHLPAPRHRRGARRHPDRRRREHVRRLRGRRRLHERRPFASAGGRGRARPGRALHAHGLHRPSRTRTTSAWRSACWHWRRSPARPAPRSSTRARRRSRTRSSSRAPTPSARP